MMKGQGDVVVGWMNKLQSAIALITPSDMLAEQHRKMAAEAGSGLTRFGCCYVALAMLRAPDGTAHEKFGLKQHPALLRERYA
jgi:hypothetical protein